MQSPSQASLSPLPPLLALLGAISVGCRVTAPHPESGHGADDLVVTIGAADTAPRPTIPASLTFELRGADGRPVPHRGRSIGRGAYSVDDVPEGSPYEGFDVVTLVEGGDAPLLAFVFDAADGDRGVAVHRRGEDGVFDLLARTAPNVPSFDWATCSPDGEVLAVWGAGLDRYERRGDRYELAASFSDGLIKVFPVVASNGRVAGRAIPQPYDAEFVVVDGVAGPRWDRVDAPVFSHDGAHVAYVADQGRERFLVVDGLPYGPLPANHTTRIRARLPEDDAAVVFVVRPLASGSVRVLAVDPPADPPADPVADSATGAMLYPARHDLPQGP